MIVSYKRIMFGQDIFRQRSPPQEENFEEVSNQHESSLFDCLEPFHKDSQNPTKALKNAEDDASPSFMEVNFFPASHGEDLDYLFPSDSLLRDEAEGTGSILNPLFSNKKKSNNTADYIIKHCLRKILSKDKKRLISRCCRWLDVTYDQFVGYWALQMKSLMPKHIGINRFEKMVKTKSPYVEVFKYFVTIYLQKEYMNYLITSSIENKHAYLDCAIKIIYMTSTDTHAVEQLLQQAQTGLEI